MNIQIDIELAEFPSVKTMGEEDGWGERFKRPIDFCESVVRSKFLLSLNSFILSD
jgi:hypothetical protein